MNYKITRRFGTFVYNPKTQGHKIKWYEQGDVISKAEYDRLSKGTQRNCTKINTRKKKSK